MRGSRFRGAKVFAAERLHLGIHILARSSVIGQHKYYHFKNMAISQKLRANASWDENARGMCSKRRKASTAETYKCDRVPEHLSKDLFG